MTAEGLRGAAASRRLGSPDVDAFAHDSSPPRPPAVTVLADDSPPVQELAANVRDGPGASRSWPVSDAVEVGRHVVGAASACGSSQGAVLGDGVGSTPRSGSHRAGDVAGEALSFTKSVSEAEVCWSAGAASPTSTEPQFGTAFLDLAG